ncbi:MAG: ArsR/SmtB family transcription factor, partial [bacterium]
MIDVNMAEDAFRTSRVMKVLGNPLRYRMYNLIHEQEPLKTGDLAEILNRKKNSISQHVSKLKKLDLIYSKRDGRNVYHYIKRDDVYEI